MKPSITVGGTYVRLGDDGELPTLEEVAEAITERGATMLAFGERAAEAFGLPGAGYYRPAGPRHLLWVDLEGTPRVIEEPELPHHG